MLLYVEAQLGEMLVTRPTTSSWEGTSRPLPKSIAKKDSHYAQELNRNPDIIAEVVAKAREKGEEPVRLRIYAKQTKQVLKIQNQCVEIKIRAERKAGILLKEMKEKGERPAGRKKESHDVTLSYIGISNKQSSRWQAEASVPDDVFEQHIALWHISILHYL